MDKEEVPSLKNLRSNRKQMEKTTKSLGRQLKTLLKRDINKVDTGKLQQLKTSIDEVADNIQRERTIMTTYYDEEPSIADDDKAYDDIYDLTLEIVENTNELISKNLFYKLATEVDGDVHALEVSMEADSEATHSEDIASLSGKIDKLSVYSCHVTELEDVRKAFRTRYLKMKREMESRVRSKAVPLASLPSSDSDTHSSISSPATPRSGGNIRLPKIELPTFDGKQIHWPVFWERFSTAVDKNPDLNDEEKLSYLRSSMKSKLAQDIVSPPTGDTHTYSTLLQLLKDAFDDKREIHRKHIKALSDTKGYRHNYDDLMKLSAHWEKHVTGLKATGQYAADCILTSMAVLCMPDKTYAEWSKYTADYEDIPPVPVFQKFLKEQVKSLRKSDSDPSSHDDNPFATSAFPPKKKPFRAAFNLVEKSSQCDLCNSNPHPLYHCVVFKNAGAEERFEMAKRLRKCTNCLSAEHRTKDCPSSNRCSRCDCKHHSMLHKDKSPVHQSKPAATDPVPQHESPPLQNEPKPQQSTSVQMALATMEEDDLPTLQMTAQVIVRADNGNRMKIRVLIDTGATSSLLATRVATRLGLPKTKTTTILKGAQGCPLKPSRMKTSFEVENKYQPSNPISVKAYLVDKVSDELPISPVLGANKWEFIKGLDLADPLFDKPGKIDAIFGSNVLKRIILPSTVAGGDKEPMAFQTVFGWAITGECEGAQSNNSIHLHVTCEPEEDLDQLLKKFWEVEQVPTSLDSSLNAEEKQAVETFRDSVHQQPDGRYEVALPRKIQSHKLGESRDTACRRLYSMEKSLTKRGDWPVFRDAVLDYLHQDHAERITSEVVSVGEKQCYYLPMHAVTKQSSTTTKVRIVFDASAKTTNGKSLNSILSSGPNVYSHIVQQILRFRIHRVAMTADISQMFRQILIAEKDRDLHRFVFRSSPDEPVSDYRMKRLTFGVTSSPYLATETLRQVAKDHYSEFPTAAEIVMTDFYVDDLLSGTDTVESALQLRPQLNKLLEKGRFLLRKWRSNSQKLLESIPDELKEKEPVMEFVSHDDCPKTLGLHWNTLKDDMYVSIPKIEYHGKLTKRQLVSNIAKVYDVMGWLSPVILFAKSLLQQVWESRVDWDDSVPGDILADWSRWVSELPVLSHRCIPRCYADPSKEISSRQIHGFSDASEKGFGAVVYLRTFYFDSSVTVSLVISKTRVAPIKRLTIPKLELAGALLLAELMETVRVALKLVISQIYAWSDSQIVLAWLDGNPRKLPTYVANRVSQILDLMPASTWRYVPSSQNPADCASRGVLPSALLEHDLWWDGPAWLLNEPSTWPVIPKTHSQQETAPEIHILTVQVEKFDLVSRYSSFTQLKRIIAFIYRFYRACQKKNRTWSDHSLSPLELNHSLNVIVYLSQCVFFPSEVLCLQAEKELPTGSNLRCLNPFLDSNKLMRVGGRLRHSRLGYNHRHPFILHGKDHLSHLILREIHETHLHAGPQQMIAVASRDFHILSCKRVAKTIYRGCVTCQKQRATTYHQLMGQLPAARVTPGPPFIDTGVDYAGPVTLKLGHVRKPAYVKAYICIFVSFTVKAVHLELVTDLQLMPLLQLFADLLLDVVNLE